MAEFLIEYMNTVIPFIASLLIRVYPMWKMRDVTKKTIFIIQGGLFLYLLLSLWIFKQFVDIDFRLIQLFKMFVSVPQLIIPFFIFRKRFWQNVSLHAIALMYGPISVGIGMYASVNWFVSLEYPLMAANMVSILAIILTLPPLLFMLKRLCENPYMEQSRVWRFIWILPMAFFTLFMISNDSFSPDSFTGTGFFIIRGLLYGALLLTCYLLESSLRQTSENIILRENARLTGHRLNIQREQYERLMEYADREKAERHDRRHHIATVWQLADAEGNEKIKAYVENLQSSLAAADKQIYCKNYAVNAVAMYYLSLAVREGVSVDARFEIPEDTGNVTAVDLCVVMGNLLENAVEACRYMKSDNRFIRVRSLIDEDTLSIVVTNSFDEVCREKGDGEGIGLVSVRAVCENYGGLMECETTGDVWKSAVLLHM